MPDPKVGLYLRISREDGDCEVESQSITNQRDFLLRYVEQRNWPVTDIYIDESVIFEPSQKTLAAQGFLVWFNFFCSINGQQ